MKYTLLLITLLFTTQSEAQLLKRIMNKAMDKVEDAAEEKAAELIADQLTRAFNRKVDQVYGDWVREAAKQDSVHRVETGDTVDWESAGQNMMKFLNGMNSSAVIRDNYTFDFKMTIKMESDKDTRTSYYYMSSTEALIMVESQEKDTRTLIIMDGANDATLMLTETDGGKKHGQALPNMAGLIKSVGSQAEGDQIKITKGTGSKVVSGYSCDQYIGVNEDYDIIYYVSDEVPIPKNDKMLQYFESFSPDVNYQQIYEIDGYPVQTIMTSKKKKSNDLILTFTEIEEKTTSINKQDYTFDGSYSK